MCDGGGEGVCGEGSGDDGGGLARGGLGDERGVGAGRTHEQQGAPWRRRSYDGRAERRSERGEEGAEVDEQGDRHEHGRHEKNGARLGLRSYEQERVRAALGSDGEFALR